MCKLKYIGNSWIPGVPSRDLTLEEIEANGWDYGALIGSGLYIEVVPEEERRIYKKRKSEKPEIEEVSKWQEVSEN